MIVKWIDSGFSHLDKWQTINNVVKEFKNIDTIIETCGEKVWEDDDWILIAGSINKKTKQIKGSMFIYKKNIVEILK